MPTRDAAIVATIRIPVGRGKPGGALSGHHPVDLLAGTLRGLVDRTGLDPVLVDDVIVGCVSHAGQKTSNMARSGMVAAGFPEAVPVTTVDRQCGPSQQALDFAAQGVRAGQDPFGPSVSERSGLRLLREGGGMANATILERLA